MAALQCEICGGKLIGKPGGVFECDSCGMEYSTEWAKAKIQEIRGTVQVEGTVEVTGTVKVEGGANKESLLKRGYLLLEDSDWKGADECFDQVLNIDPECAEAYVGKYCVEREYHTIIQMAEDPQFLLSSPNIEKALRFGTAELREQIENCQQAAMRQAEEGKLRLAPYRELIRPAASRIFIVPNTHFVIGLYTSGRIITAGTTANENNPDSVENLKDQVSLLGWKDITAITGFMLKGTRLVVMGVKRDGTVIGTKAGYDLRETGWRHDIVSICSNISVVGLKENGTVVCLSALDRLYKLTKQWCDLTKVVAGNGYFVGLKSDGTVCYACYDRQLDGIQATSLWTEIVDVAADDHMVVGLKPDGTVVFAGEIAPNVKAELAGWSNIAALSPSGSTIMGLKPDGTVATYDPLSPLNQVISTWTDIVSVFATSDYAVGLKSDGTLIHFGDQATMDENNLSGWKLFNDLEELRQAQIETRKCLKENQAKRSEQRVTLKTEQAALQTELANLKGLFSGKRRKEIEARLAAIAKELEE